MTLTGLGLTQVLTVLGVAGGLVFLLYLLKLRRRRIEVPFVKLWNEILAEKQTTRLFSQLKRWMSLLVALLIVAALAFALGDPRPDGATAAGRAVVVLIDASASMQARDIPRAGPNGEETSSRFEEALRMTRALIDELGPNDRMLIAQLDDSATPLSPLTSELRVLQDATREVEVTEVGANLRAGIRVALDILRGQANAEVVLLSDGRLDEERFDTRTFATRLAENDVRLSWQKIGRHGDNVGIAAFSVRRYPLDKSQSEVLVELENPTDEAREVELELLGDGASVDIQRLTLAPQQRLRRFFRNISGVDQTLEARLHAVGNEDFLQADDHAFARLPERRRARVLVVSEGNLYLQAALLLDEYLDVTETSTTDFTDADGFDVVIFDDWVPPSTSSTPALYLHPASDDESRGPFVVNGTFDAPYFDHLNRRHPLLKWTALSDVNVARALDVDLQPGDRAIARDNRGALIVAGSREGTAFVSFNFDVRESDLPLRVAWPLLLLNTVDFFVQESAGFVSSYHTGDTWHIPAPAGLSHATVIEPSGEEREVPIIDGRAVFAGKHIGFHTLRTPEGDEQFAANIGPGAESHIEPAEDLHVGDIEAGAPTRGEVGLRREIWLYLVLLVLLILCIEWFTYHRRMTV